MVMEFIDLPLQLSAQGVVRLPGSKSISNRVLLLSALAAGETEIRDLLESDDTARMLEALAKLGVKVLPLGANAYRVCGAGGAFPVKDADFFLGNAGTAFRSLTAVLALAGGRYALSGVQRRIRVRLPGAHQVGACQVFVGGENAIRVSHLPVRRRHHLEFLF